MKKYLKFTAFMIFIFATSCSKDDTPQEEQLPTGENTAYYYLDGQLIVPKGVNDGFGSTPIKPITISLQPHPNPSIDLGLNDGGLRDLNIFLFNGIQSPGVFSLNFGNSNCCNNINSMGSIDYRNSKSVPWIYFETKTSSGTVTIENLSPDKRKFSGTFQMDVYSNTNEVKHITNGHFNINLDTL